MRHRRLATLALSAATLGSSPALAQPQPTRPSAPAAAPAPSAPTPGAATPGAAAPAPSAAVAPKPDQVIAKVGSDTVHYADLQDAISSLPDQLRQLPPNMLYPMLVDQLVDRDVILQAARKQNLQDDPAVKQAVARATAAAMQNTLLTRAIQPTLTPDAIKAVYDKEFAGKPGEEEVKAMHILVPDEAKAKEIIAELKNGADFADLAKKYSTDPSAKENSGSLGWFKKGDMLPEFSEAAFALKPGETTPNPVHTRFGWHVIKVEDHRTAPAPTLDQVRDQIRQQIIQEGVAKVLADAKQGLTIEKFNLDGSPMTDAPAQPAPGK